MTDLVELRGHTPGPWEVHQGNGIVRKCEGEVCQVIADMRAPYKHGIGIVRGEQQQWANARLIAKAPELLDRIETLEARLLEAEMRAHKWMEAHDKLAAGKPYDFPKPADLPEALAEITRLTAEVERLTPRYAQPCFGHEYITPGCPDCGKLA